MKSYSEAEVFKPHHLRALDIARYVVEELPDEFEGEPLRCHEVAWIVQRHLLPREFYAYVATGRYAMVEHSWLYLEPDQSVILDPYSVGRLPPVQLVHTWLELGSLYKPEPDPLRTDLRTDIIQRLTI